MNSFGQLFRISIFGESHGSNVGICVDGCPAGIPLQVSDFEKDIVRRKSGAKGTTPRIEDDQPLIATGVFNQHTTGAPITILFENNNTKSKDYSNLIHHPRPGHSDFVASRKYHGFNDYRGGGYFSGRLTLPLVAAGVIAKKILPPDINIQAKLIEAGGHADIDFAINEAIREGDSIGGIVECRVSGLPVGLGEPFFSSAHALLSHIVFSIPAIKGIEFGDGFTAAMMHGSEHNDCYIDELGTTETNHAGGLSGGMTNGNPLIFRVAVKPTSSTSKEQKTFNFESKKIESLKIEGRHDLCIALRVPPVIEAVTAIVFADLLMIHNSKKM